MFKKTQKGFALVETVLILVIVGLVAFVAWYAFRTKSDTESSLDITGSTQIAPPQSKENKSNSSDNSTSAEVVATKTDSKHGQYLADSKGMTLYTYSADTAGVSNCTGSCLYDWPVYDASSAPASLPDNITVVSRSDGKKQYAYKGMPLYYYTGDNSAGQVTGDGVNDFHLAKP